MGQHCFFFYTPSLSQPAAERPYPLPLIPINMFALIPTVALLAGLSAAAPTYKAPATPAAAAGATIYKSKHFAGDSTAIPANAWCTDLSDIFGDFDGQVRSLAVEKGYRCQFFLDRGCSDYAPSSRKLDLSCIDSDVKKADLEPAFDLKLHSAYCALI